MWPGYVSFGGAEVINSTRTEKYVLNDGSYWFRPVYNADDLYLILGDDEYRSPLQDDDAPWVDPQDSDTYGFYGVYPLSVDGIESSTRTSVIVENTGDGGNVGRIRHATRQVVFSALLLGESDAAVDAGMRWLRNALLSGTADSCYGSTCFGTSLCYFNAKPAFDPDYDGDCALDQLRYLYQVSVNSGPTVTDKKTLSDGACMWTVQWTAVAGIPWEFGQEMPIFTNAFSRYASYPYWQADGVTSDRTGYTTPEVPCSQPQYRPVFDPGCPDLALPPVAPGVPLGCYAPPKNWHRYLFRVPADYSALWTDVVPVITMHAPSKPVQNLRIRIFPDLNGNLDPESAPCSWCADMVVTYVPEATTMVLDGRDETVKVYDNGQERPADGLVYGSDRKPFNWPQMTCGIPYLVVIDGQQTQVMPRMDLTLVPKAR